MTNIKFDRVGDVVDCLFEGGSYQQVGEKTSFTFTGKTKSRRQLRTIVKDLLKLTEKCDG